MEIIEDAEIMEPKAKETDVPAEGIKTTPISAAVEDRFKWVEQRIKHLNDVMTLVIVVLAVGFVAILLAVISILIQWWGFNANIQKDLMASINQLTNDVNNLNSDIKSIPSTESAKTKPQ